MDELVRQALAKWPDVPDCTGWLALDARGRWRVGEAKDGPRQPITHAAMNAFIDRNYHAMGRQWVFQNGPQRVFVELEYTPYVWRLSPAEAGTQALATHNGIAAEPSAVWLDDAGRFLFEARPVDRTPLVGVVHDHDTALVAALLRDQAGRALDDDVVDAFAAEAPGGPTATALDARLEWRRADGTVRSLPVQRIAAGLVAEHFGFDPAPSLAVRADVDTRR